MSGRKVNRIRAAALVLVLCVAGAELRGWYYFTASNGQRAQWPVSHLSISVKVDSDYSRPATLLTNGSNTGVLDQWNRPFNNPIMIFNTSVDNGTSMTITAVRSFLRTPVAGTVWIVHDLDGSVITYFGGDKNSVLGFGIPLTGSSPDQIVAGVVIMNDYLITTDNQYKQVLLHELGHVLGFAHSVSAGNKNLTVNTSGMNVNWPIMYPFIGSNLTLQKDDMAAAISVYGR